MVARVPSCASLAVPPHCRSGPGHHPYCPLSAHETGRRDVLHTSARICPPPHQPSPLCLLPCCTLTFLSLHQGHQTPPAHALSPDATTCRCSLPTRVLVAPNCPRLHLTPRTPTPTHTARPRHAGAHAPGPDATTCLTRCATCCLACGPLCGELSACSSTATLRALSTSAAHSAWSDSTSKRSSSDEWHSRASVVSIGSPCDASSAPSITAARTQVNRRAGHMGARREVTQAGAAGPSPCYSHAGCWVVRRRGVRGAWCAAGRLQICVRAGAGRTHEHAGGAGRGELLGEEGLALRHELGEVQDVHERRPRLLLQVQRQERHELIRPLRAGDAPGACGLSLCAPKVAPPQCTRLTLHAASSARCSPCAAEDEQKNAIGALGVGHSRPGSKHLVCGVGAGRVGAGIRPPRARRALGQRGAPISTSAVPSSSSCWSGVPASCCGLSRHSAVRAEREALRTSSAKVSLLGHALSSCAAAPGRSKSTHSPQATQPRAREGSLQAPFVLQARGTFARLVPPNAKLSTPPCRAAAASTPSWSITFPARRPARTWSEWGSSLERKFEGVAASRAPPPPPGEAAPQGWSRGVWWRPWLLCQQLWGLGVAGKEVRTSAQRNLPPSNELLLADLATHAATSLATPARSATSSRTARPGAPSSSTTGEAAAPDETHTDGGGCGTLGEPPCAVGHERGRHRCAARWDQNHRSSTSCATPCFVHARPAPHRRAGWLASVQLPSSMRETLRREEATLPRVSVRKRPTPWSFATRTPHASRTPHTPHRYSPDPKLPHLALPTS